MSAKNDGRGGGGDKESGVGAVELDLYYYPRSALALSPQSPLSSINAMYMGSRLCDQSHEDALESTLGDGQVGCEQALKAPSQVNGRIFQSFAYSFDAKTPGRGAINFANKQTLAVESGVGIANKVKSNGLSAVGGLPVYVTGSGNFNLAEHGEAIKAFANQGVSWVDCEPAKSGRKRFLQQVFAKPKFKEEQNDGLVHPYEEKSTGDEANPIPL